MNISNGVYKSIRMNWGAFTFPVPEGTPVSAAGIEANNESAIGILPQSVQLKPLIPDCYVLVSGAVADMSYELSDKAVSAMAGIDFVDIPNASGGGLPAVTSDDNGDVLTVVDGVWDKAAPSGGLPDVTIADANKVLAVSAGGEWDVDYPYVDPDPIMEEFASVYFAYVEVDGTTTPKTATSNKDFYDFFGSDLQPRLSAPMFAKLVYADLDGGVTVDVCPITVRDYVYMGSHEYTASFDSQTASIHVTWMLDQDDPTIVVE